jgi:tetratricopeptide (TPR) repeat protein
MLKANARGRSTKAACLATVILVVGQPGLVAAQQAAAANSQAADIERAERHAADAYQAYSAGRYGTAVSLYVQAYNAAPNADILYNIARIYDTKLGDRQLAMTFYRRYIADPGALADRIKIANERLAALREAELAAEQSQPTEIGTPIRVSSGALAPAEPERSWSNQELVGVLVGAAGVVGIGIGVGFGIAAMSGASTAKELCDGNACRERRGVIAANDANQNARVSTVGFAAGGVLLGIGTALFLSADKSTERAQSGPVRWSPVASKSSVALEVSGAW